LSNLATYRSGSVLAVRLFEGRCCAKSDERELDQGEGNSVSSSRLAVGLVDFDRPSVGRNRSVAVDMYLEFLPLLLFLLLRYRTLRGRKPQVFRDHLVSRLSHAVSARKKLAFSL
jgi:hypothetical protein